MALSTTLGCRPGDGAAPVLDKLWLHAMPQCSKDSQDDHTCGRRPGSSCRSSTREARAQVCPASSACAASPRDLQHMMIAAQLHVRRTCKLDGGYVRL